ncbi:hydrolase [Actinotalea sp. M2MS4P-6]|uniref:nitrilase-related carbon-nitrogen hydrolase n=1 Tax=Actinotalea sp. M2MS4P-6 TaxID=2983762 RepID=UPI0021E4EF4D|nr:nitrilase-related carbon-nitrogen hydrolase [Actinotalea sp. M2MS4P-6]MCV2396385.1 hydrolase [Actinotalea sp. M2MS4P-6]
MRARLVGLAATADAAANREAAVQAVRDAAADGLDLVVLPEFAGGFDPRGVGRELAEPLDGPFVGALRAASAGITTIAGTVVPAADDRAVNVVVAVRDGVLLGSYAKVHLYDAFGQRESDLLVPGPPDVAPLVLDVAGLRVGVMTCYDLRFPESARRLVDAGAEAIAVPAAWAGSAANRELKSDHWRTLLRARAIENTVWTFGVPMRGAGVVGDLLAVDPLGEVVAEAAPAPGVRGPRLVDAVDVSADPAVVAEVRVTNPSLANRRYTVVPR